VHVARVGFVIALERPMPKAPPAAHLTYRHRHYRRRARRAFDATVATTLLLIATPAILLACLCIMIEDGRPFFFTQRRAGRFERLFVIYKLRTMYVDQCGDRPTPRDGSDPRVTRVGRILRKTSIDELPQLINVIRGDMTLVGPRPEMPLMIHNYERWQHMRHLVTPGLTCIWQTTSRSDIPLHRPEATALDLDYIRNASPTLDGSLIAQTVVSVLRTRGAF
jgi:lipopolysaccharide/colanic/teichoic acid biosynthesis glycosyltransferase